MLKGLLRGIAGAPPGRDAETELLRIRDLIRAGRAGGDAALDAYLVRHPHDPKALHLRGLLEYERGQWARAAEAIGVAVAYDPDSPIYRANLGMVLQRLGRLDEARAHLEATLETAPGLASALLNLASLLSATGRPGEARARLEAGLAQPMADAQRAQVHVALAGLAERAAGIDALAHLRRALALDPDHPFARLLCFRPLSLVCDWSYPAEELAAFFEALAERDDLRTAPALAPYLADCVPVSRRGRFAAARRTAVMFEEEASAAGFVAPVAQVVRDGRVRVGYLSSDLHQHPTMHLLRGVLAGHDRRAFVWHAFSAGPDDGSALRRAAVAAFDEFHDIRELGTRDAAALIAARGIDILVDLKGYTGDARTEVVALRPAPVQVSYLGYPGGMAANFIDYLIADSVVVPPGEEAWFAERIVTLPDCYQANDDRQPAAGASPTRAEAGLPADAFVFASFNATYKIEPRVFSAWMRILARVPDAVLWILADNAAARANLSRAARAAGVEAGRLVFTGVLPRPEHLARIALADLCLDTWLVNGHTTGSDVLWAGLPMVTCVGDSFGSRVGASLLGAAGLPELACAGPDEYVALAVALARDPARLATLRARLRAARDRAPLFDTRAITRHLEAAYAEMHARRLRGEAPAAFCVRRGARA